MFYGVLRYVFPHALDRNSGANREGLVKSWLRPGELGGGSAPGPPERPPFILRMLIVSSPRAGRQAGCTPVAGLTFLCGAF
jgi:hypothetical protein